MIEVDMHCGSLNASASQDDPLPTADAFATAVLSGARRVTVNPSLHADLRVDATIGLEYNNDESGMPLFQIGKVYHVTIEEVTP